MKNNNRQNSNNKKPPKANQLKYPKNPDKFATPSSRGMEGMKMMRAISKRKFNLFKDGDIFRDLVFVNDTIVEAQKRYVTAYYHYQAMMMYYNNVCQNEDVRYILKKDGDAINAYCLIIEQLSNIVKYRDTGYLDNLLVNLPRYRGSF